MANSIAPTHSQVPLLGLSGGSAVQLTAGQTESTVWGQWEVEGREGYSLGRQMGQRSGVSQVPPWRQVMLNSSISLSHSK